MFFEVDGLRNGATIDSFFASRLAKAGVLKGGEIYSWHGVVVVAAVHCETF